MIFYSNGLFAPVWKTQSHSVPVFFELFESAVEFDYFHAQIVAGIEYSVNLPINT
jgi:hypothetical protein